MKDKAQKFFHLYKSCFYKRDPHIWIFGAWFGNKYSDNSKYLFEEANKYENVRAIWVTNNDKVLQHVKNQGYEAYLMRSEEGISLQKRAKYFFSSTGFQDFAWEYTGNAVNYELWHGIPLKKIGWDDTLTPKQKILPLYYIVDYMRRIPRRKEYIIAPSEDIKRIYMSCFRKRSDRVLVYGQPRNDLFYNDDSSIKTKFGENRKVILYMPTHRRSGKTKINCNIIFNIEELNDFCRKNNCIFVIKKHYYHRDENTELIGCQYVIDITKEAYDPQELLYAADILITDYSSCYYDYLLLDRPVLFYNYDYDDYLLNDREMYYKYDEVTPGIISHTFEELLSALSIIVCDGIDEFHDERTRVRDLFYDKKAQRNVSRQIIDDILYKEGLC